MRQLISRSLVCLLLLSAVIVGSAVSAKSGPNTPPSLSASWSHDLAPIWHHVYNLKTSPELPQHLIGDGQTDDLPALDADFQWLAANGGGVLYAPAGTYRLVNIGPNRVFNMTGAAVLEGDGIDKTIFRYIGAPNGIVQLHAPNVCGFYRVTMICDAPDEQPPYSFQALRPAAAITGGGSARDVFLKDVKWDIGSGRGLEIGRVTNMDVEDSTFLGLRANHGTVNFGGGTNVLVTRNFMHYKSGRVVCNMTSGLTFTHNKVIRVGGRHTPQIESGGLECSYSQPALIAYNDFTVDVDFDNTSGDGETILTQNDGGSGGYKRFTDNGTLTAAGTTTLSDSTKTWPSDPWPNTTMALITSGAGLGQVRPVVSHTSSSATISTPWKVQPVPGDQYTLLSFPAKDMVIKNNTLKNTAQGILMYSGAYNVSITGNTLINADSILIRSIDQPNRHQPAWDNIIAHNTVTNPDGRKFSAVGLLAFQLLPTPHGNLSRGNVVIENKVGKHPSGVTPSGFQQEGIHGDGVYSQILHHPEFPDVAQDRVPNVTNGR